MFQHEAVASFESPTGAAAATTKLVELGYAEHEVGIEPHGYRAVTGPSMPTRITSRSREGAVMGAATGGLVALAVLLGLGEIGMVLIVLVLGGAAGALLGAVTGAVNHLRSGEVWEHDEQVRLAPSRFDVVVARDPDLANHTLARWWDPAAPPASRREAA